MLNRVEHFASSVKNCPVPQFLIRYRGRPNFDIQRKIIETRKWHSESADPAKALGTSDILDRNPEVGF